MEHSTSKREAHPHDFLVFHAQGEQRTRQVLVLTLLMMIVEVVAGTWFGSMALLADGWHMGTHVGAFLVSLFAYRYARQHARNPAFAFGTGKVSVLGGFASAVALAVVALVMLIESAQRLFVPAPIQFNEALGVALVGLLVNLLSALLLQEGGKSVQTYSAPATANHPYLRAKTPASLGKHSHGSHSHAHDHNLKSAYFHVLADALTSVLAIAALLGGKAWGWFWLDPLMGIVGAGLIARWAYGLIRETSLILLDASLGEAERAQVQARLQQVGAVEIADFHIWKVGEVHYAGIISLVTDLPHPPEYYRELLREFKALAHLTIEVNPRCENT